MPVKYTGITIGPIYSTLELTSSPAGLWGASYLFSCISRDLCKALVAEGIPAECFIAPCFQMQDGQIVLSEECEEMRKKGVGLFHDRIIFRSDKVDDPLGRAGKARQKVVDALALNLKESVKTDCTAWLNQYLRILAIQMPIEENTSPLIYLGKKLSALELEPQFPSCEAENPLLSLFENSGRENGFKNAVLKDSFLRKEVGRQWMLFRNENNEKIRDLTVLANQYQKVEKKYQQYYAVLKSDGDSMGKILESLTDEVDMDGAIQDYSRKCLAFCARAAKEIQKFGGMPIYAGGDDLLALLPVVNRKGDSLFALIEKLRTTFNTCFQDERNKLDNKPTISFGVAVQYYKSPLYEALERADTMLRKAKKSDGKNACFLNLQKHSGQSMLIFEWQMDKTTPNLFAHLETLFQKTRQKDAKENVTFLSGAGYQVEAFKPLFYEAIRNREQRREMLKNLFANLFDNADQQKFHPYLAELNVLTELIFNEQEGSASKEDLERCIDLTCAAIRAIHFLNESREEG